jgi:hypothetical protein
MLTSVVIKKKLSLMIPAKKSEIFVSVPANPSAIVVFLFEEGKNRKNRKSDLAQQIFNKTGIALISASYKSNTHYAAVVSEPENLFKEITEWIDRSILKNLPIGLFIIGDGYPSILKFTEEHPNKAKAIIVTCISKPFSSKNLNSPVMLLSGSFDNEINEPAIKLLKSKKVLFDHKIIKDSSRYFSELGKLGEALTISCKWLKKLLINRAAA